MGKKEVSIEERLRGAIRAAEKQGTTRAEIARKAGVNESQISRLMSGKTLTVPTLERIAVALGGRIEFQEK